MSHKLLLADDSVTIQRVIELTFADEDVQVTAVGNGQDAIERVQRDRPDIILADIGMPERNGYEVAAFVKGNPSTAHIPVVLLTGAFEPIDEDRARAVGCDGVLVKPFEPQIVISRVKDLLAGRAPAGMWNAPPAAQGPVRHASGDVNPKGGGATTAAPSDPLEAYFDRLDAAFASSGTSAPAADPFAGVTASSGPAAPMRETIPLSRRPAPGDAPAAAKDTFADWDPDLKGDPAAPAAPPVPPPAAARTQTAPVAPVAPAAPAAAPAQPAPPPQPAATASAPPPQPAAPPPAPLPASLVDAFAALLAAEQKIGLTPSAAMPPVPPPAPTTASEPAPITEEMIDEVANRVLSRLSAEARPSILDVAERLVREEIERIKRIGE